MVWTGNEVLVIAGFKGQGCWNDAAAYNPATNTWRRLPDAPQCGWGHPDGIWTGTEAIIWGAGDGEHSPVGMAYTPATNTWRRLPDGPLGIRTFPSIVWTGREAIVWGGYDLSTPPPYHAAADGAAYDPATNQWRRMAASPLSGRFAHGAAWTGTDMIVWGGLSADGEQGTPSPDQGAAYNPVTDTWRALPESPVASVGWPLVAWTGDRLVVWSDGHGAGYEPRSNRWTPLAPGGEGRDEAVWTSRYLIVYGGSASAYDTATDQWLSLPPPPSGTPYRISHRMVWTGREVVFFGGALRNDVFTLLDDGAVFRPAPR
ncbi:MAG: kelch motif-containing protein [Actinobacteria bacterium]|nr:kelch motif-containing protein [Actinomycetota bacterium]